MKVGNKVVSLITKSDKIEGVLRKNINDVRHTYDMDGRHAARERFVWK